MTQAGMLPSLILEGGATRIFEMRVEQCLVLHLRPGQVVAIVHGGPYIGPRGGELIEARGAELQYLPSYSPDLNPIEEGFSKVKTLLRPAGARTEEGPYAAIRSNLRAITSQDASEWLRHASYCLA